MPTILLGLQIWCLMFALFTAVASFAPRHYPDDVEEWTGASLWLGRTLSILTIIAASITLFDKWNGTPLISNAYPE